MPSFAVRYDRIIWFRAWDDSVLSTQLANKKSRPTQKLGK